MTKREMTRNNLNKNYSGIIYLPIFLSFIECRPPLSYISSRDIIAYSVVLSIIRFSLEIINDVKITFHLDLPNRMELMTGERTSIRNYL